MPDHQPRQLGNGRGGREHQAGIQPLREQGLGRRVPALEAELPRRVVGRRMSRVGHSHEFQSELVPQLGERRQMGRAAVAAGADHAHPHLRLPAVRPARQNRCVRMNTMMSGTIATKAPTITSV